MESYNFFVAHEYSNDKKDDLRDAIESAFENTKLKPYYADVEIRQKYILEKIEKRILETQFGIYDLSNSNPNVCLELGFARAVGKPCYIILRKGSTVPSNLQGLDRIEYDSYKNLTKILKEKVVDPEIKKEGQIKDDNVLSYYENLSDEEVITRCSKLYQSEELRHKWFGKDNGYEVRDKDAWNKKAWFFELSNNEGHFISGPYELLPELGEYIALFKVKTNDNTSSDPLILIDVLGGMVKEHYFSSRLLYGVNFKATNKYQLFALKFKYSVFEPMEYRGFTQKQWNGKVWLDYIAIVKIK